MTYVLTNIDSLTYRLPVYLQILSNV